MVARGCRMIVIGRCQAADLARHRPKTRRLEGLRPPSAHKPPPAEIQRTKCALLPASSAIRGRSSHPHQYAPHQLVGIRVRMRRAEPMKTSSGRFCSDRRERGAASPAAAARVRRAMARRPGFAGFALAPAGRDATADRGLPEAEGGRKPIDPGANHGGTPQRRSTLSSNRTPTIRGVTPVSPAMDEQLLASIKAIGIIQPPIVVEKDGALVINAGDRRVKQAIRADFADNRRARLRRRRGAAT